MIRVRQAAGQDVPTVQLFRTPTIAGLAEALERSSGATTAGASQAISRAGYTPEQRAAGVPCSANQEQMLVLHQMAPTSPAYNMAEPVRLRGAVDEAALEVQRLLCLPAWCMIHDVQLSLGQRRAGRPLCGSAQRGQQKHSRMRMHFWHGIALWEIHRSAALRAYRRACPRVIWRPSVHQGRSPFCNACGTGRAACAGAAT